jgi:predicted nuclease of predicted toxin-antitoxin system
VSLRLYMDVHVRRAVTAGLRLREIDVLIAQEDGAAELDDAQLLDRATSLGRVVFTQDRDFLREGTERQRTGRYFSGIVYAHQIEVTTGQCLRDLEIIARAGEPPDAENQII